MKTTPNFLCGGDEDRFLLPVTDSSFLYVVSMKTGPNFLCVRDGNRLSLLVTEWRHEGGRGQQGLTIGWKDWPSV